VSDYIRQEFQLGAQKAISWHGADGRPVEGILTLPVGYMRGSRYPLAVLIHGGPAAADHFGIGEWPYLVQVLAGRGYLVLQPNYRGSTGYGDAFMRDVVGHYFNQDYRDIEHGVAALIERGLVLREQVVVFGWSAGAHLTNKLITSTDIFAAAASGAGVADWRSLYAESDLRASRDAVFGGPPWRSPEVGRLYDDSSPIQDVSVARTPTILFAGAEDRRIPPAQAVMLYNALRAVGVTTTLYVAPAEGHGWVKPLHRLFQSNAELAWFERFARHRAYAWDWPESGSPASGP
jgi:dipeptidyl aminopeptidase/acylaminoacyl peptidase